MRSNENWFNKHIINFIKIIFQILDLLNNNKIIHFQDINLTLYSNMKVYDIHMC